MYTQKDYDDLAEQICATHAYRDDVDFGAIRFLANDIADFIENNNDNVGFDRTRFLVRCGFAQ